MKCHRLQMHQLVRVAVPIRAKRKEERPPRTLPRRVRRPRAGFVHEKPPRRLILSVHMDYRCGAYSRGCEACSGCNATSLHSRSGERPTIKLLQQPDSLN